MNLKYFTFLHSCSVFLQKQIIKQYTLTSPDGSVEFQLKHNVAGRSVYAEGTADAVKFLAKKIHSGNVEPTVYSMINVLEEGALE